MASRHLSRIAVLQALFAADIRGSLTFEALHTLWKANTESLAHGEEDAAFSETILKTIAAKLPEIDAVIVRAAPQWPLEKIAIMDRTVLRIGLCELLYLSASVPPKVALNEAIELAKTFGGDSSPKFVNGVLGSVYRDMGSPRSDESPKEKDPAHAGGAVVVSREPEPKVALICDRFNYWTLPKSKVEEGELSHDAARRAAREELGLSISDLTPLTEHRFEAHEPEKGVVGKAVGYFGARVNPRPLSPRKSSVKEARWFTKHELATLTLYEDLRPVIESWLAAEE